MVKSGKLLSQSNEKYLFTSTKIPRAQENHHNNYVFVYEWMDDVNICHHRQIIFVKEHDQYKRVTNFQFCSLTNQAIAYHGWMVR